MKYRALIVGAGRVGAAYQFMDDGYSHAGAYRALEDRVELVGFVEPDVERRKAAEWKWDVATWDDLGEALEDIQPKTDIVSVCTQPEQRHDILCKLLKHGIRGVWCEKPWVFNLTNLFKCPVQVNYLRRACSYHQKFSAIGDKTPLVVYGKDDVTTRCHFEDLARWWKTTLDYRVYNGPCAYACCGTFFDNGGINAAACMTGMLGNLLDAIEGNAELWSPPY